MSIKLEGIEEVLEILDSVENVESTKKAMEKACLLVERDAKKKAVKGITGDLRKFMNHKVELNGNEIVGTVFNPLLYAPYVEYGTGLFAENGGRQDVPWNYQDEKGEWHSTKGMPPHPFLRPAFYENKEKILKILKESMHND